MNEQTIQVKEKQEVQAPEQTLQGRVFTPPVDIYETEKAITLLADIPGVEADDLSIDLAEGVLTLAGNVKPSENKEEQDLMAEYETGSYYRQFRLSDIIDQGKIEANLTDGVLHLILPKAEEAQPRKIQIKSN